MTTILIADDSFGLRLLVIRMLETHGHRVIEAIDGDRALELIVDEHPDLAILDVIMPGRDGFEVCRAVRTDPGVRATPIIMISANATEDEARAAGADAFLAKPFLPS